MTSLEGIMLDASDFKWINTLLKNNKIGKQQECHKSNQLHFWLAKYTVSERYEVLVVLKRLCNSSNQCPKRTKVLCSTK